MPVHSARVHDLSVMAARNKVEEIGGSARGAVARQGCRLSALLANAKSRHYGYLTSSNIHNSDIMSVFLVMKNTRNAQNISSDHVVCSSTRTFAMTATQ